MFRKKQLSPERQEAVSAVLALLQQTPVGELLSYQRMSGAVGERVDSQHYAVAYALRQALKGGINFRNVLNQGYVRHADSQIATTDASRSLLKGHRAMRRGLRRISNARYEHLTIHERASFHAKSAAMQAIKQM